MKSESIAKLSEIFDLNLYETKSYLALLEKDSLSAVEVAKISGVPRGRIYEILISLSDKGLCHSIPGKTKKYKASNPDLFHELIKPKLRSIEAEIENEIKDFDADIEKRKREFASEVERRRIEFNSEIVKREKKFNQEIEQKKRDINTKIERKKQGLCLLEKKNDVIVEELMDAYLKSRGNGDPLDYIEVLKNPVQIHRKYLELYSKAQSEIISFVKPPFAYASEEQIKEQQKVQFDAVERNVRVRTIIQLPPKNELKAYFEQLRSASKYVETKNEPHHELRLIDELPVKMFVFDNRICFFTLEDPLKGKTSLTMLLTEHVAMARSFRFLFESFWEKSQDYFIIDGEKHYLYPEEIRKHMKGGEG